MDKNTRNSLLAAFGLPVAVGLVAALSQSVPWLGIPLMAAFLIWVACEIASDRSGPTDDDSARP